MARSVGVLRNELLAAREEHVLFVGGETCEVRIAAGRTGSVGLCGEQFHGAVRPFVEVVAAVLVQLILPHACASAIVLVGRHVGMVVREDEARAVSADGSEAKAITAADAGELRE